MPKGVVIQSHRDGKSGFIKTVGGEEILFDRSQLQGMQYDSRLKGQQVEFEVGQGSTVALRRLE